MYGQKISMVCGDQYLDQPERLYRRIRELRGGPFHLVQLYIWNAKYMVDHPRVVEVVERAVQVAHDCGLRAGLMIAGNALAELWHPFLCSTPMPSSRRSFHFARSSTPAASKRSRPGSRPSRKWPSRIRWLTWPVYAGVLGAYAQTTEGAWNKVALNDVAAEFQAFHDSDWRISRQRVSRMEICPLRNGASGPASILRTAQRCWFTSRGNIAAPATSPIPP